MAALDGVLQGGGVVVGVLLVDVASVLGDEQRDDVVEAVDGGDLQRGPAVLRHAVRAHRVLLGYIMWNSLSKVVVVVTHNFPLDHNDMTFSSIINIISLINK